MKKLFYNAFNSIPFLWKREVIKDKNYLNDKFLISYKYSNWLTDCVVIFSFNDKGLKEAIKNIKEMTNYEKIQNR